MMAGSSRRGGCSMRPARCLRRRSTHCRTSRGMPCVTRDRLLPFRVFRLRVMVQGRGLSIKQQRVACVAGMTGCEGTEWVSETSVACRSGGGVGGGAGARMLVWRVSHRWRAEWRLPFTAPTPNEARQRALRAACMSARAAGRGQRTKRTSRPRKRQVVSSCTLPAGSLARVMRLHRAHNERSVRTR
jgi:hypothetical protein